MRILFLSDFCPWPLDNGYRQRIYNLIVALSSRHQVTLASVMPDEVSADAFPPGSYCAAVISLSTANCPFSHTRRFERWARPWDRLCTLFESPLPSIVRRWQSPDILTILKDLRKREQFDIVWAERPFIAELAREAGFARIVVDLPDIETVAFARALFATPWYRSKALHWLEVLKLFAYEQAMPFRFWRLVPCKDEDRRFFKLRRANVVTLPNGVDDYPEALGLPNDSPTRLMFVGALDFDSNIDAIRFFAESILPLIRQRHSDVEFVVIGRNPGPEVRELQQRHGFYVLADIVDLTPQFDRASLFVAPIRMGSGTRLKVLEALVRGKAVVATSVAVEGLNLRSGVELEVADSAAPFAAACIRLLGDPDARRRLATAGRQRVRQHFLWNQVTPILHHVLGLLPDVHSAIAPSEAEELQ
jgi:glycosyltransferase involved in cell wall biosynthesis